MSDHDIAVASQNDSNEVEESLAPTTLIRFGTNRNRVASSDMFGPEFEWGPDSEKYHAGSIPLLHVGEHDAESSGDKQTASAELHLEQDPKKVIRDFLRDAQRQQKGSKARGKQSLVYIHGYAFKFLEVFDIERVIASRYGSPNNLFFSWPSYGDHLKYREDRDHAYGSGRAAGKFLRDLLDEVAAMADPPKLSLLCHSMGNRVMSAIVQYLKDPKYLRQYFDHILLFAADEDYKALEDAKKLQPITKMYKHSLNVYTNGDDAALALGQIANGGEPELGSYGPYVFPIRDDAKKPIENAYWINCQKVADPLFPTLRHQYFRLSDEVIADARHVLEGMDAKQIPGRYHEQGDSEQKFTIRKS